MSEGRRVEPCTVNTYTEVVYIYIHGTFTFYPLVWTSCSDLSSSKFCTQFYPPTFTTHSKIPSRRYSVRQKPLTGGPDSLQVGPTYIVRKKNTEKKGKKYRMGQDSNQSSNPQRASQQKAVTNGTDKEIVYAMQKLAL
jgi:hypothetical protein